MCHDLLFTAFDPAELFPGAPSGARGKPGKEDSGLKVNGQASYGTKASPFQKTSWGRCTCRRPPGGKVRLSLHVLERPRDEIIRVPALSNSAKALPASMLTSEGCKPLTCTQPGPGEGIRIKLPPAFPDPFSTRVVLDIHQPG